MMSDKALGSLEASESQWDLTVTSMEEVVTRQAISLS